MKLQYRRVDLTTVKGIQTAERLQANGWKIVQGHGAMFSVLTEKPAPAREARAACYARSLKDRGLT